MTAAIPASSDAAGSFSRRRSSGRGDDRAFGGPRRRLRQRVPAISSFWALAERSDRRWRASPSARRRKARGRRCAFQREGLARATDALGHRVHRGRSAGPGPSRSAAEASERRVHGRPQVRLLRRRRSDMGDECACPCPGRRGLRGFAHRRLLVRLRVPLRRCASRRRHRIDAGRSAARRVRLLLRGARGDVPIFFARCIKRPGASSVSTMRSTCVTACCPTSRRGSTPARHSISRWATSTSSGRATPTSLRSARSIIAPCHRVRST